MDSKNVLEHAIDSLGEGVARGVPTAKLRATGPPLGCKSQERGLGAIATCHQHRREAARTCRPTPLAAAPVPTLPLQCEWHDACLLSVTYANCAKISSRPIHSPWRARRAGAGADAGACANAGRGRDFRSAGHRTPPAPAQFEAPFSVSPAH